MTLLGALFRTIGFLIGSQKDKRECIRLDKQGKIAERDVIVNRRVPEWARYMIDLMGERKSKITVNGIENVPQDTAVVFVANHQGYMDIPFIIGYSGKPTGFIAKAEILKVPMLSGWMKLMQCTFLKRNSPRQSVEAMAQAVITVKKGYSLVIFPEGHRSKGETVKEFHPGSFKLAFRAEVPIIPVTLDGTWHLFEEKRRPNAAEVSITFHPAVPTAGLSREEQSLIPEKVRNIIISALPTK